MSPLFRVVLAEVPPARAGVGGGVLTTTQQTALALGVATLGTLYLSFRRSPDGVRATRSSSYWPCRSPSPEHWPR